MRIYFDPGPNSPTSACLSPFQKMSCWECCFGGKQQANPDPTNVCNFCELVRNLNAGRILLETPSAVVVSDKKPEGAIHLLVVPKLHLDGVVTDVFGKKDLPLLHELGGAGRHVVLSEISRLGLKDCSIYYAFHRRPGKHMVLNVVVNPFKTADYLPDTTGRYRDYVISLDWLIEYLSSRPV